MTKSPTPPLSYSRLLWRQFCQRRLGLVALGVVLLFALVGIYAPFLASSKPLLVRYEGAWYFPLFRYLFFTGFFTKRIDLFFNLFMFFLPPSLLAFSWRPAKRNLALGLLILAFFALFLRLSTKVGDDPASDPALNRERQEWLSSHSDPMSWEEELRFMPPYQRLNLVLRHRQREREHRAISALLPSEMKAATLWQRGEERFEEKRQRLEESINALDAQSAAYRQAQRSLAYLIDKRHWLDEQSKAITWEWNPLLRPYHWEDDAGGEQGLNRYVDWMHLTRINRKDLVAALVFGVRISLVVGVLAVAISLVIGVPIGAMAGYFGGRWDIVICRFIEIWESMPTFFMLLMVVAITQSKSIFLVVTVLGIFGWTGFSRFLRGEFLKQRNLPYVEACQAMGFGSARVIFGHILPNAVPPLLTLLPFAVLGAITSEAGLSFLGLGEEGSCSWGVLMDEGRQAFPGESYLLWPPALMLTFFLVAIALVGDALRDALDPKMRRLTT